MPTRYEYDIDSDNHWRWIALAANGATVAISPVGYASLQDCMHAVGLMRAPGISAGETPSAGPSAVRDPPELSLSRLHLHRS